MKLSQCMIVKNEEKNIERALSWGKGIVFEQIVVDTGSTDRTVELARKMGATVYHFNWINDFAAAKNYAIEQASGDWIAFLDADEFFNKETVRKLPQLLDGIDTSETKKKADVIICNLLHLDENYDVVISQGQTKIFRNKPYIRYFGKIHENIKDIRNYKAIAIDLSKELPIYHTGYVWTEESKKRKGNRNLEILYAEYARHPSSAALELYIADSLRVIGDMDKAFEYYCKAVQNKDNSLPLPRLILAHQMRLYEAAARKDISTTTITEMYKEALLFNATWPDFDIAMGFFYYRREYWQEAVLYLEEAIQKMDSLSNFTYSRAFDQWKNICAALTSSYMNMQNWPAIMKYGSLYLKEEKMADNVLIPIMHRLLNIEQTPAEVVIGYLQKIYDFNNVKDLLFLIKCSKLGCFLSLEDILKTYLSIEDRNRVYKEDII